MHLKVKPTRDLILNQPSLSPLTNPRSHPEPTLVLTLNKPSFSLFTLVLTLPCSPMLPPCKRAAAFSSAPAAAASRCRRSRPWALHPLLGKGVRRLRPRSLAQSQATLLGSSGARSTGQQAVRFFRRFRISVAIWPFVLLFA
jgi:hypothetical protein